MFDSYNRDIHYLRISVTDRCNLRCVYCMPEEGIEKKTHGDMLTYEEITDVVRAAIGLGFDKFRLTGGEPLVRKGIDGLVRSLAALPGIGTLAMTTNGTLLADKASVLKDAGLDRVNVSLDTLQAARYTELTRGGNIEAALAGIDAALSSGLCVKVNMVVLEDTRDSEIAAMREFCGQKGLGFQTIRRFRLSSRKVEADIYDRPPRCADCDRIRLLADGTLKPCLFSDHETRLDMNDLSGSLRRVIALKPGRGSQCGGRNMSEIGG